MQDAKYLGNILKCRETGYVRCCGVSLLDVMRSISNVPVQNVDPISMSLGEDSVIVESLVQETVLPGPAAPMAKSISDADMPLSASVKKETTLASRESITTSTVTPTVTSSTTEALQSTESSSSTITTTTVDSIKTTVADNEVMTAMLDGVDQSKTMSNLQQNLLSVEEVAAPVVIDLMMNNATVAEMTGRSAATKSVTTTASPPTSIVTPSHIIDAERESTSEIMIDDSTTTEATLSITTESDATTTIDDALTTDDTTSTESIETNVIHPNEQMKMRRPKLVDNVLMVYPNEMSGVPQTTPKNMPQLTNEVHMFDENAGMSLHVIYSTNRTSPEAVKADVRQNEIESGERNGVTAPNASSDITTESDVSEVTTIEPEPSTTTTVKPQLKPRRFTPIRLRPLGPLTVATTPMAPTTTTTTTVRPARSRPLLLAPSARLNRTKTRPFTSETTVSVEEIAITTPASTEKPRNKLFGRNQRFNLLQKTTTESTATTEVPITTNIPTTRKPIVLKQSHYFNRKFAKKIDNNHQELMERVRKAIDERIDQTDIAVVPRSYWGDASVNNRIVSLEKLVADRAKAAIGSGKQPQSVTETAMPTETTTPTAITNRGRYRFSRKTTTAPVTTTASGDRSTTSAEMRQHRFLTNSFLRRRMQTTTSQPKFTKPSTTTSPTTTTRHIRRRPTQQTQRSQQHSANNRSTINLTPKKTYNVTVLEFGLRTMQKTPITTTTPMPSTSTAAAAPTIKPSAIPVTATETTLASFEKDLLATIALSAVSSNKEIIVRRSPAVRASPVRAQQMQFVQQVPLEPYVFHGNEQIFQLTPSGGMPPKFRAYDTQTQSIPNGHQKPLIIGPIPRPSDSVRVQYGLPAESQGMKFYF